MTRENKLVMVIGFGLLLFVGILVSDHLSARDSQFSNPASIVEVALERDRLLPPTGDGRVVTFGQPERAPEQPAEIGGVRFVKETDANGQVIETPPAPPVPAAERTHTVAKGENPEKIAQKYYGKKSLATALAKYNGIDPTRLKIGQVLKVPDISVVDPKAAPAVAGGEPSRPAEPIVDIFEPRKPESSPEPKPEVRTRTTTVQKGDNLWKIAARTMGKGTSDNVAKLKAMNPGINEKNLKVGAQLKLASAQ